MAIDDVTTLRVSTEAFPDRDRVEAFREIFGRTILRIEIEPLPDHPLAVDMTLRGLPGLGMASGLLSPMRNRHAADLADNDDLVLVAMVNGTGSAEQCGREASIGEGQAILTANGEPGTFVGRSRTRLVNFRLSRALLASRLPNVGDALLRPVPRNDPGLRLLMAYAGALSDEQALGTPELRHAVVTHMHDLAALTLGATRDAAEIARGRGLRAARLRAIKADIADNALRRDLTLEAVAGRHGISPRYVAKLLADESTTFTELVLAQRLARAHGMLIDPRRAERTISAIAFAAGFGDLSYFNHAFRRRYGATPSDVRAAARRAGDW